MRAFVVTLLLVLTLFAPIYGTADMSIELQDSLEVSELDTPAKAKKHPWRAGLEIAGFNVAMVGVNRIINKDESWSHVTMNSIKHNITHRYWAWDQEDFGMNAFRHPVHGTFFYLTARANGMSVGESSLYTLGGTWMWEIYCEAQDPSINDMVYTTVGGITIGETLWRSGKCLLDMARKGKKRKASGPFTTSLSVGYRSFKGHGTNALSDAFITWEATCGDLFDDSKRGPFDYFNVSGTLVTGQRKKMVSQTRIDNQLWSCPVIDEPQKKVVAGIYNHFDFIRVAPLEKSEKESFVAESYNYSEVGAIGPGIAYRLGEHIRWEQQLYVNGILLGAVPEYDFHSSSSGYSFGSGYGARLYSSLSVGNSLQIGLRAQCSHLFTWDGFYADDKSKVRDGDLSIQGEEGNALTAIIAPSIEWRPLKHFALVGNGMFMHTHMNYKYHPHTSTHAWEWQIGVKYRIDNRK